MKRKRIKPEDFIGWKSEDGNLEVVGILDSLIEEAYNDFC